MATVDYAPGSHATGTPGRSGSGGSGGRGPPKQPPKSHDDDYCVSPETESSHEGIDSEYDEEILPDGRKNFKARLTVENLERFRAGNDAKIKKFIPMMAQLDVASTRRHKVDLSRPHFRHPALIHVRSKVAVKACVTCRKNKRHFKSCRIPPSGLQASFGRGGCTNCGMGGKWSRCSFVADEKKPAETSARAGKASHSRQSSAASMHAGGPSHSRQSSAAKMTSGPVAPRRLAKKSDLQTVAWAVDSEDAEAMRRRARELRDLAKEMEERANDAEADTDFEGFSE